VPLRIFLNSLNPLIALLDPLNAYDPAILAKYYFNGAVPNLPNWSRSPGMPPRVKSWLR
jgi:hypothetical protein